MNRYRHSSSFLFSLLLSVMLLVQNWQISYAKSLAGLTLQNTVIDASVFDLSKNDLVIENATGLRKTVLVQPLDRSIKAVRVEGVLKDGSLHIDLSHLGKANLLPEGMYTVTAMRGKKRLRAEFELNPPTLYVSKVSVPISNLSSETKQRILRYHHNLEGNICYSDPCPNIPPDQPQCGAPVIEVACDDPSCNSGPCITNTDEESDIKISCHCYDPENLDVLGQELEYPGEIEGDYITAEITLETTADYQKPDCGIKAEVVAYDKKEAELSCITFLEDAAREEHKVESELNNATTAAADVYLAANTEADSLVIQNGEVKEVNLSDLYNKTVEECKPLVELPPDDEAAKAVIANAAQKMAEEFKKAILEASGDKAEFMKLAVEKAAEFAAKCPNFTGLPPQDLINPEMFNKIKYHEIAGGLLDPKELGIPEDSQVLVDLFKKEGIVPGSLKLPSYEEAMKAFKEGSAPIYSVDGAKLAQNFAEMQKIAKEMGYEMPQEIIVPPGTVFDPKQAVDAFKQSGINDATFTLAPTCIVQGQYDQNTFNGGFNFKAEPGVIAHESFNNVFSSIPLQEHNFLPGTVFSSDGNATQAYLPSTISEYINKYDMPIPTGWLAHPQGGVSTPIPNGWTPSHDGVSNPIPTGWMPTHDGTSEPDPTGWVPQPLSGTTSDPIPNGWTPPADASGHPMQPPATTQPVSEPVPNGWVPAPPTTTVVSQPAFTPPPSFVPPPSDFHPPTSH